MGKVMIGGQAVIEGVMMKNEDIYAVAVRKPDNEIEVKNEKYESIGGDSKILKAPFIRGVFNFLDSMIIGIKTLLYSASFYEEEEEMTEKEKKKAEKKAEKESSLSEEEKAIKRKKEENRQNIMTVMFSLVAAIVIFMIIPALLSGFLEKAIPDTFGIQMMPKQIFHFDLPDFIFEEGVIKHFVVNIIEGVLRLMIFLGYSLAISLMPDIKRLFMYHGAEHKTINCLEAGEKLTPENVMKHSRFHKRCGTSFIFMVMLISVFIFMFIQTDNTILRIVFRVLLIPVVASISYEFIRLAGKNDSKFMTFLSQPGLWVQRITTKEPDLSMIEVAISSVEAVFDWETYLKEQEAGKETAKKLEVNQEE